MSETKVWKVEGDQMAGTVLFPMVGRRIPLADKTLTSWSPELCWDPWRIRLCGILCSASSRDLKTLEWLTLIPCQHALWFVVGGWSARKVMGQGPVSHSAGRQGASEKLGCGELGLLGSS